MISARTFAALLALAPTRTLAQKPVATESLRYVMPHGNGAITVKASAEWAPDQLNLLDNNTRLAAQLTNKKADIVASYILFPNPSHTPTAAACRAAVMAPILENLSNSVTVTPNEDSTWKLPTGEELATSSYVITKASNTTLEQRNIFAFAANASTCAEIHISKVLYKPADKPQLDAVLNSFRFDLNYVPTPTDYGIIGTLFFNYLQDYAPAAIYFQRGLDTLPTADITAPTATPIGRVIVDQLAMAYGISGNLTRARSVLNNAIQRDPDYPLYYYNLACTDAESGDATAARTHLQQAFDRRAHMIPGEHMPDPSKDDSLLKLKDNADFWGFVQSLPKN